MRESVTISLPPWLKERLDKAVTRGQTSRSDVVREALGEYFGRQDLERIRRGAVPLAEASGVFTDEDIFREVS